MKVWVLGSGSGGNAVVIESEGSRILIDAGFGTRTLSTRLKVAGVHPGSIESCVITHEHSDHIKGAAAASRKWGWPLFASTGTARSPQLTEAGATPFTAGETLTFSRFEVATAATPHDSADPVGMVVTSRVSGVRAGICYDIGHASDGVRALCRDVDVLVLESNHDEEMLRSGPYPVWLKKRIACETGHLGNRAAAELAQECVVPRLAHLVLAHLSEQNNTPDVARRNMARALAKTAFRGQLSVASQDGVVGPFGPRGARRESPLQLALF